MESYFREFECVPSCPIDTRDRAASCSGGYVTRMELAACGHACGTAAEHHCPPTPTNIATMSVQPLITFKAGQCELTVSAADSVSPEP
jgi:hypothetical protein